MRDFQIFISKLNENNLYWIEIKSGCHWLRGGVFDASGVYFWIFVDIIQIKWREIGWEVAVIWWIQGSNCRNYRPFNDFFKLLIQFNYFLRKFTRISLYLNSNKFRNILMNIFSLKNKQNNIQSSWKVWMSRESIRLIPELFRKVMFTEWEVRLECVYLS